MPNNNDKDEENNISSDNSIVPIPEQKVHILITDADTYGTELAKMSDFMEEYAKLQVSSLSNSSLTSIMVDIPIADIGIINDVIQHARIVAKGDISLIPNFEHLPADIRDKLKKGLYSIGESKQIDGNMRAVILNENGTRVKDITLKKVYNNPGTHETTRSITNQLQMKQINDKLAAIQEIQSYQLDKDRDHAIFTPFLNARDNILLAQNSDTQEQRNIYLKKAAEQLREAKNGIKTEINTAVTHLAKYSKYPLFHRQSTISTLTSHIADDLQFSTKICGITMQVYEYLGQPQNAKIEMKQYQAFMTDFLSSEIGNTGYTAIDLLHDNFRYNKNNVDCWYDFSIELKIKLSNIKQLESRETYIVTLEDSEDE